MQEQAVASMGLKASPDAPGAVAGDSESSIALLASPAPRRVSAGRFDRLEQAIVHAVAYADVFDYPLTAREIHRYLEAVPATLTEVQSTLNGDNLRHFLSHARGQSYDPAADLYALPYREHTFTVRARRALIARWMRPRALAHGRAMARLPFVRMVALTGTLAVNNVEPDADMDFLVVAANDRLWLCRALVIGLVRLAARRGDTICPNYFLAERALAVSERNLYTAHEMMQMVPIAGLAVHAAMLRANDWMRDILPNAAMPSAHSAPPRASLARSLAETTLSSAPGAWAERWEMRRKMRKLARQPDGYEADFKPDWCKGHFDGHQRYALAAYASRLAGIG